MNKSAQQAIAMMPPISASVANTNTHKYRKNADTSEPKK